jgi:hypothetical protein
MQFSAFVVNKVHDDVPVELSVDQLTGQIENVPSVASLGWQREMIEATATSMLTAHHEIQTLAAADRESLLRLRARSQLVVTVAFLDEDVHDLDRLAMLGNLLWQEPANAG